MKNMKHFGFLTLALVASYALVGCASEEVTLHTPAKKVAMPEFKPNADAGVPVARGDVDWKAEGEKVRAGVRPDPFALRTFEKSNERSQLAANLLANSSWYGLEYEEKLTTDDGTSLTPLEAQPDRRLAGVLVGDTVTALIDMGDGSGIISVRPGQIIEPAKEWQVYSIDEEKAILRRTNKRVRPEFVVVRLGPNLSGGAPGDGGGGGGNLGGGEGGDDRGRGRGPGGNSGQAN
jgi:hypothetical protein